MVQRTVITRTCDFCSGEEGSNSDDGPLKITFTDSIRIGSVIRKVDACAACATTNIDPIVQFLLGLAPGGVDQVVAEAAPQRRRRHHKTEDDPQSCRYPDCGKSGLKNMRGLRRHEMIVHGAVFGAQERQDAAPEQSAADQGDPVLVAQ